MVAYVRRARTTTRTYRPRKTIKKTRGTYTRKKLPSRFMGGAKKTYKSTKNFVKKINPIAESIYVPITQVNEATPTFEIGTTKTYYQGWTLGSTVPNWNNFEALGGMTVAQGSGTNERSGQWGYLKKTHLKMSIDMKPNTATGSSEPIVFRLVIFKARPSMRQFGNSYSPGASLFYDEAGQEFGYDTAGINAGDINLQPLNVRRWCIYKSQKFTLTPPGEGVSGSANSYYKSRKEISIDLPFYRKVRFNASNEPQDIDTHYGIMVFATSIAKFNDANRYEVNIRGTTTLCDL